MSNNYLLYVSSYSVSWDEELRLTPYTANREVAERWLREIKNLGIREYQNAKIKKHGDYDYLLETDPITGIFKE